MAIPLPNWGWWHWVWDAIGLITNGEAWPDGDEDKLDALAKEWRDWNIELSTALGDIERSAADVRANYFGDTGQAIAERTDGLLGRRDDEGLRAVAQNSAMHAAQAQQAAYEIRYAKYGIITATAWTIGEMYAAMMAASVSFGIGAAATGGILVSGRAMVGAAWRRLVREIGESGVRGGLTSLSQAGARRLAAEAGDRGAGRLTRELAQHAIAEETAEEFLVDFVPQAVLASQGHGGFDLRRTGMATLAGAGGGALGVRFFGGDFLPAVVLERARRAGMRNGGLGRQLLRRTTRGAAQNIVISGLSSRAAGVVFYGSDAPLWDGLEALGWEVLGAGSTGGGRANLSFAGAMTGEAGAAQIRAEYVNLPDVLNRVTPAERQNLINELNEATPRQQQRILADLYRQDPPVSEDEPAAQAPQPAATPASNAQAAPADRRGAPPTPDQDEDAAPATPTAESAPADGVPAVAAPPTGEPTSDAGAATDTQPTSLEPAPEAEPTVVSATAQPVAPAPASEPTSDGTPAPASEPASDTAPRQPSVAAGQAPPTAQPAGTTQSTPPATTTQGVRPAGTSGPAAPVTPGTDPAAAQPATSRDVSSIEGTPRPANRESRDDRDTAAGVPAGAPVTDSRIDTTSQRAVDPSPAGAEPSPALAPNDRPALVPAAPKIPGEEGRPHPDPEGVDAEVEGLEGRRLGVAGRAGQTRRVEVAIPGGIELPSGHQVDRLVRLEVTRGRWRRPRAVWVVSAPQPEGRRATFYPPSAATPDGRTLTDQLPESLWLVELDPKVDVEQATVAHELTEMEARQRAGRRRLRRRPDALDPNQLGLFSEAVVFIDQLSGADQGQRLELLGKAMARLDLLGRPLGEVLHDLPEWVRRRVPSDVERVLRLLADDGWQDSRGLVEALTDQSLALGELAERLRGLGAAVDGLTAADLEGDSEQIARGVVDQVRELAGDQADATGEALGWLHSRVTAEVQRAVALAQARSLLLEAGVPGLATARALERIVNAERIADGDIRLRARQDAGANVTRLLEIGGVAPESETGVAILAAVVALRELSRHASEQEASVAGRGMPGDLAATVAEAVRERFAAHDWEVALKADLTRWGVDAGVVADLAGLWSAPPAPAARPSRVQIPPLGGVGPTNAAQLAARLAQAGATRELVSRLVGELERLRDGAKRQTAVWTLTEALGALVTAHQAEVGVVGALGLRTAPGPVLQALDGLVGWARHVGAALEGPAGADLAGDGDAVLEAVNELVYRIPAFSGERDPAAGVMEWWLRTVVKAEVELAIALAGVRALLLAAGVPGLAAQRALERLVAGHDRAEVWDLLRDAGVGEPGQAVVLAALDTLDERIEARAGMPARLGAWVASRGVAGSLLGAVAGVVEARLAAHGWAAALQADLTRWGLDAGVAADLMALWSAPTSAQPAAGSVWALLPLIEPLAEVGVGSANRSALADRLAAVGADPALVAPLVEQLRGVANPQAAVWTLTEALGVLEAARGAEQQVRQRGSQVLLADQRARQERASDEPVGEHARPGAAQRLQALLEGLPEPAAQPPGEEGPPPPAVPGGAGPDGGDGTPAGPGGPTAPQPEPAGEGAQPEGLAAVFAGDPWRRMESLAEGAGFSFRDVTRPEDDAAGEMRLRVTPRRGREVEVTVGVGEDARARTIWREAGAKAGDGDTDARGRRARRRRRRVPHVEVAESSTLMEAAQGLVEEIAGVLDARRWWSRRPRLATRVLVDRPLPQRHIRTLSARDTIDLWTKVIEPVMDPDVGGQAAVDALHKGLRQTGLRTEPGAVLNELVDQVRQTGLVLSDRRRAAAWVLAEGLVDRFEALAGELPDTLAQSFTDFVQAVIDEATTLPQVGAVIGTEAGAAGPQTLIVLTEQRQSAAMELSSVVRRHGVMGELVAEAAAAIALSTRADVTSAELVVDLVNRGADQPVAEALVSQLTAARPAAPEERSWEDRARFLALAPETLERLDTLTTDMGHNGPTPDLLAALIGDSDNHERTAQQLLDVLSGLAPNRPWQSQIGRTVMEAEREASRFQRRLSDKILYVHAHQQSRRWALVEDTLGHTLPEETLAEAQRLQEEVREVERRRRRDPTEPLRVLDGLAAGAQARRPRRLLEDGPLAKMPPRFRDPRLTEREDREVGELANRLAGFVELTAALTLELDPGADNVGIVSQVHRLGVEQERLSDENINDWRQARDGVFELMARLGLLTDPEPALEALDQLLRNVGNVITTDTDPVAASRRLAGGLIQALRPLTGRLPADLERAFARRVEGLVEEATTDPSDTIQEARDRWEQAAHELGELLQRHGPEAELAWVVAEAVARRAAAYASTSALHNRLQSIPLDEQAVELLKEVDPDLDWSDPLALIRLADQIRDLDHPAHTEQELLNTVTELTTRAELLQETLTAFREAQWFEGTLVGDRSWLVRDRDEDLRWSIERLLLDALPEHIRWRLVKGQLRQASPKETARQIKQLLETFNKPRLRFGVAPFSVHARRRAGQGLSLALQDAVLISILGGGLAQAVGRFFARLLVPLTQAFTDEKSKTRKAALYPRAEGVVETGLRRGPPGVVAYTPGVGFTSLDPQVGPVDAAIAPMDVLAREFFRSVYDSLAGQETRRLQAEALITRLRGEVPSRSPESMVESTVEETFHWVARIEAIIALGGHVSDRALELLRNRRAELAGTAAMYDELARTLHREGRRARLARFQSRLRGRSTASSGRGAHDGPAPHPSRKFFLSRRGASQTPTLLTGVGIEQATGIPFAQYVNAVALFGWIGLGEGQFEHARTMHSAAGVAETLAHQARQGTAVLDRVLNYPLQHGDPDWVAPDDPKWVSAPKPRRWTTHSRAYWRRASWPGIATAVAYFAAIPVENLLLPGVSAATRGAVRVAGALSALTTSASTGALERWYGGWNDNSDVAHRYEALVRRYITEERDTRDAEDPGGLGDNLHREGFLDAVREQAEPTPEVEHAAQLLSQEPSPAVAAAIIHGLGEEAAQQLALSYPEVVGNTDGVPDPLRFLANRQAIDKYAETLLEQGPRLGRDARRRYSTVGRLRHPVRSVITDADGDPLEVHTPRQILEFDPSGHGRVVEVLESGARRATDLYGRPLPPTHRYRRPLFELIPSTGQQASSSEAAEIERVVRDALVGRDIAGLRIQDAAGLPVAEGEIEFTLDLVDPGSPDAPDRAVTLRFARGTDGIPYAHLVAMDPSLRGTAVATELSAALEQQFLEWGLPYALIEVDAYASGYPTVRDGAELAPGNPDQVDQMLGWLADERDRLARDAEKLRRLGDEAEAIDEARLAALEDEIARADNMLQQAEQARASWPAPPDSPMPAELSGLPSQILALAHIGPRIFVGKQWTALRHLVPAEGSPDETPDAAVLQVEPRRPQRLRDRLGDRDDHGSLRLPFGPDDEGDPSGESQAASGPAQRVLNELVLHVYRLARAVEGVAPPGVAMAGEELPAEVAVEVGALADRVRAFTGERSRGLDEALEVVAGEAVALARARYRLLRNGEPGLHAHHILEHRLAMGVVPLLSHRQAADAAVAATGVDQLTDPPAAWTGWARWLAAAVQEDGDVAGALLRGIVPAVRAGLAAQGWGLVLLADLARLGVHPGAVEALLAELWSAQPAREAGSADTLLGLLEQVDRLAPATRRELAERLAAARASEELVSRLVEQLRSVPYPAAVVRLLGAALGDLVGTVGAPVLATDQVVRLPAASSDADLRRAAELLWRDVRSLELLDADEAGGVRLRVTPWLGAQIEIPVELGAALPAGRAAEALAEQVAELLDQHRGVVPLLSPGPPAAREGGPVEPAAQDRLKLGRLADAALAREGVDEQAGHVLDTLSALGVLESRTDLDMALHELLDRVSEVGAAVQRAAETGMGIVHQLAGAEDPDVRGLAAGLTDQLAAVVDQLGALTGELPADAEGSLEEALADALEAVVAEAVARARLRSRLVTAGVAAEDVEHVLRLAASIDLAGNPGDVDPFLAAQRVLGRDDNIDGRWLSRVQGREDRPVEGVVSVLVAAQVASTEEAAAVARALGHLASERRQRLQRLQSWRHWSVFPLVEAVASALRDGLAAHNETALIGDEAVRLGEAARVAEPPDEEVGATPWSMRWARAPELVDPERLVMLSTLARGVPEHSAQLRDHDERVRWDLVEAMLQYEDGLPDEHLDPLRSVRDDAVRQRSGMAGQDADAQPPPAAQPDRESMERAEPSWPTLAEAAGRFAEAVAAEDAATLAEARRVLLDEFDAAGMLTDPGPVLDTQLAATRAVGAAVDTAAGGNFSGVQSITHELRRHLLNEEVRERLSEQLTTEMDLAVALARVRSRLLDVDDVDWFAAQQVLQHVADREDDVATAVELLRDTLGDEAGAEIEAVQERLTELVKRLKSRRIGLDQWLSRDSVVALPRDAERPLHRDVENAGRELARSLAEAVRARLDAFGPTLVVWSKLRAVDPALAERLWHELLWSQAPPATAQRAAVAPPPIEGVEPEVSQDLGERLARVGLAGLGPGLAQRLPRVPDHGAVVGLLVNALGALERTHRAEERVRRYALEVHVGVTRARLDRKLEGLPDEARTVVLDELERAITGRNAATLERGPGHIIAALSEEGVENAPPLPDDRPADPGPSELDRLAMALREALPEAEVVASPERTTVFVTLDLATVGRSLVAVRPSETGSTATFMLGLDHPATLANAYVHGSARGTAAEVTFRLPDGDQTSWTSPQLGGIDQADVSEHGLLPPDSEAPNAAAARVIALIDAAREGTLQPVLLAHHARSGIAHTHPIEWVPGSVLVTFNDGARAVGLVSSRLRQVVDLSAQEADELSYLLRQKRFMRLQERLRHSRSVNEIHPVARRQAERISYLLAKLPPVPGVTQRIANLPSEVVAAREPGRIVVARDFTNTSRIFREAWEGRNVVLEVHGRTGRDVTPFTGFRDEAETMFVFRTEFNVVRKTWSDEHNLWFITQEEEVSSPGATESGPDLPNRGNPARPGGSNDPHGTPFKVILRRPRFDEYGQFDLSALADLSGLVDGVRRLLGRMSGRPLGDPAAGVTEEEVRVELAEPLVKVIEATSPDERRDHRSAVVEGMRALGLLHDTDSVRERWRAVEKRLRRVLPTKKHRAEAMRTLDNLGRPPRRRGAAQQQRSALVRRGLANGAWWADVAAPGAAIRLRNLIGGWDNLPRDQRPSHEERTTRVRELFDSQSLSPGTARRLARMVPDLVGNRSGVPFELRFLANRVRLKRQLLQLQDLAERTHAEEDLLAELRELQERQILELVIEQTSEGTTIRSVEVLGDPASTDHIGVVLYDDSPQGRPESGAGVSDIRDRRGQTAALWEAVQAVGGPRGALVVGTVPHATDARQIADWLLSLSFGVSSENAEAQITVLGEIDLARDLSTRDVITSAILTALEDELLGQVHRVVVVLDWPRLVVLDPLTGRMVTLLEVGSRLEDAVRVAAEVIAGTSASSEARRAALHLRDVESSRQPPAELLPPLVRVGEVARVIGSLNPLTRDELLRTEPELIGNLDGVPYQMRFEANRARIGKEIARLQGLAQRTSEDLLAQLRELRGQQILELVIERTLGSTTVRYVEVLGDPGSADYIGVVLYDGPPEEQRRYTDALWQAVQTALGERTALIVGPVPSVDDMSASADWLLSLRAGLSHEGEAARALLTVVAEDEPPGSPSASNTVRTAMEQGLPVDRAVLAGRDPVGRVVVDVVSGDYRALPRPVSPTDIAAIIIGQTPGSAGGERPRFDEYGQFDLSALAGVRRLLGRMSGRPLGDPAAGVTEEEVRVELADPLVKLIDATSPDERRDRRSAVVEGMRALGLLHDTDSVRERWRAVEKRLRRVLPTKKHRAEAMRTLDDLGRPPRRRGAAEQQRSALVRRGLANGAWWADVAAPGAAIRLRNLIGGWDNLPRDQRPSHDERTTRVRELFDPQQLSPGAARRLARMVPELVGNRSGVPFELRFLANRVRLKHRLLQLQDLAERTHAEEDLLAELRELEGRQILELFIEQTGDRTTVRYVEVLGDPSEADHIGVALYDRSPQDRPGAKQGFDLRSRRPAIKDRRGQTAALWRAVRAAGGPRGALVVGTVPHDTDAGEIADWLLSLGFGVSSENQAALITVLGEIDLAREPSTRDVILSAIWTAHYQGLPAQVHRIVSVDPTPPRHVPDTPVFRRLVVLDRVTGRTVGLPVGERLEDAVREAADVIVGQTPGPAGGGRWRFDDRGEGDFSVLADGVRRLLGRMTHRSLGDPAAGVTDDEVGAKLAEPLVKLVKATSAAEQRDRLTAVVQGMRALGLLQDPDSVSEETAGQQARQWRAVVKALRRVLPRQRRGEAMRLLDELGRPRRLRAASLRVHRRTRAGVPLLVDALLEAEQRRDLAEALRDSLMDLNSTHDPDEVLRRLFGTVVRMLPGDTALLLRGEEAGGDRLVVAAADGTASDRWSASSEPVVVDIHGHATMEALVAGDAPIVGSADPITVPLPSAVQALLGEPRSWLAVPVVFRQELAGLVVVGSSETASYADTEVDVASTLAEQGAVAYENAHEASVDELTGVATRAHFLRLAEQLRRVASRHGRPLAVIMLDVDRFESVNDTYGHLVGDDVLREVAARLRNEVRDSDIVGRYGGDEFAIVLPELSDDASHLAERLRAAIAEREFQTEQGPLEVTASLGVSHLQPREDLKALLTRADDALYTSKGKRLKGIVRRGNRVTIAEPPT